MKWFRVVETRLPAARTSASPRGEQASLDNDKRFTNDQSPITSYHLPKFERR